MAGTIQIILIDTMVTAGLLAVTKTGDHVETQKKEWFRAINNLIIPQYGPDFLLHAPTPVCYELMCWNKGWYQQIKKTDLALFKYKNYDISHKIIDIAEQYALSVNSSSEDENKLKVKTIDPLIAAYCLYCQYPLLTTNECDYPEQYFSVGEIETLKLTGKNGKIVRKLLFLLIPKKLVQSTTYQTSPTEVVE